MNENIKEILVIILASLILGITISYTNPDTIALTAIFFLIIISINILVKKILAYSLEADVKTKFWEVYQYGFRKDSHFKKPVPMVLLPPIVSFITKGTFFWLAILETEIKARVERVSKRHGLYRFSEMNEWDMSIICTAGIIANLLLAFLAYTFAGVFPPTWQIETLASLSIYYAFWSLIPISSLDGSKILFGSRFLWFTMIVITAIFFGWSLIIV